MPVTPVPQAIAPPAPGLADRLYTDISATVARRTRWGRTVRTVDGALLVEELRVADAEPGAEPGRDPAARLQVVVLDEGHVRIRVGHLGECLLGYGVDRVDDTAVEAIEWLDAVLDGRVRETLVVADRQVTASRVTITWRDGARTRLATPGAAAAARATHQRRQLRYAPYIQR